MALRGGNAMNKGSARKSAKFVKPKQTPAQKGAALGTFRGKKAYKKMAVVSKPTVAKKTVGSKGRKQRRAR